MMKIGKTRDGRNFFAASGGIVSNNKAMLFVGWNFKSTCMCA